MGWNIKKQGEELHYPHFCIPPLEGGAGAGKSIGRRFGKQHSELVGDVARKSLRKKGQLIFSSTNCKITEMDLIGCKWP